MDPNLVKIHSAFGDKNLVTCREQPKKNSLFRTYLARIVSARFPGIIPTWLVVVLEPQRQRDFHATEAALFALAATKNNADDDHPIFVILEQDCEDIFHSLAASPHRIFSADPKLLPAKITSNLRAEETFFAKALRAKVWTNAVNLGSVSPFKGQEPPERWRFYGRQRELNRILESTENFLILGPRRMGKTSLLLAVKDELEAAGKDVRMIDCSDCRTVGAVATRLVGELDPRESSRLLRHAESTGERPLQLALKAVEKRKEQPVLLIDEIGVAMKDRNADEWRMFGLLRSYSQKGVIRVIFTCFDEVVREQVQTHDSPLNNFGVSLPISYFTDEEVESFLVGPLRTWFTVDGNELATMKKMVLSSIGRHPFLLQTFGRAFFVDYVRNPTQPLLNTVKKYLFGQEHLTTFHSAVFELWDHMPSGSSLLRAMFLTRCHELEMARQEISNGVFDDDWLQSFLNRHHLRCSYEARRHILEAMELHGFSARDGMDPTLQLIGVPALYRYLSQSVRNNLTTMTSKYVADIAHETKRWGLQPL